MLTSLQAVGLTLRKRDISSNEPNVWRACLASLRQCNSGRSSLRTTAARAGGRGQATPWPCRFDLHEAEERPGLFLVHENWKSEEDLSSHFEIPYLRAWVAKADGLLAEPMELTRWHRAG